MDITVDNAKGKVPVTILRLSGTLDGSSYQDLIDTGIEAYDAGARDILIDLGSVTFMSSAGLVALQTIARLLRGEGKPSGEEGWDALHSIAHDKESSKASHFRLLNPQPQVDKVLDMVGLKQYFPTFKDEKEALQSF